MFVIYKMFLKLFIFIVVVVIYLHYIKYNKKNEIYQIDQQELEFVKGNELYNNLNPMVITFIEDNTLKYNVETYNLYSPISINFHHFIINTNNNFLKHTNEILIIRSKKQVNIELVNSSYSQYFKQTKSNKKLDYFQLSSKHYSDVKSIEIKIHEYNALYIPRFWYFKFMTTDLNVEIFVCDNIFTRLFNIVI